MSENKSITLPTFSGKDEAFQVWWTKFRALATAKGFAKTLFGRDPDLPENDQVTLEPDKDQDKLKIEAKKMNSLGMAYLLQAFKSEANISLPYKTMDRDWPGGLAYATVGKLLAIYKPDDTVTEVEVYEKLLNVKMKKNADPKVLFEQVAAIQNWYNTDSKKLPKEQVIAVVLKAAPKEYASVLTAEQNTRGTALELSHLRAVMNKYYRQVNKKSGGGSDGGDDELALAGKDGKNNNGGKGSDKFKKKFTGKCHECGKVGHMARDCWLNPKNKGKRPQWYDEEKARKSAEVAAAHSGGNNSGEKKSDELQLVNVHWGQYEAAFESDDDGDVEDERKMKEEMEMIKTTTATETMLRAAAAKGSGVELLEDPEIFVLDTGATTHSTGHGIGLVDLQDGYGRKTTVGNGAKVSAKAVATLPFKTEDGTTGKMSGVHLIQGAPFNLISGTKLLAKGFEMHGNKDCIVYKKEGQQIKFGIKIKTPEGMLFAARLQRTATATEVGGAAANVKTMSIKTAHELLGHMNEAETRKAAATMGWTIARGILGVCESCAKGKAKQKNVANNSPDGPKPKAEEVGGRVYLDLSRLINPNDQFQPRRPNWCLVVDETTGYKTSSFHETKDGMVEPTCARFKQWAKEEREVKIIRMDNAGENKKLVKQLNSPSWQLYPKIEYTARDTPQHNHLAEVGFATLYGRGRAMMIKAKVPADKKHIVGQKAFETATDLDNLVPVTIKGETKTRAEHWHGHLPAYANHLRKWGEAGVVKIKNKQTTKMEERGITCMFVGYAKQHAGDCYEMLNLQTNRVLITRDVLWLNKMYFSDNSAPYEETEDVEENEDEDKEEKEQQKPEEVQPEAQPPQTTIMGMTRSGRTIKPPVRYVEEIGALTYDEVSEIMAVGAGIGGGFLHTSELKPMKYEEAMAKDPDGWGKAVKKEYDRMKEHEVFQAVKKEDVPKGAKVLTSTWAMKQKADGTLRARLNARGFEQKAGEHYEETGVSSPVVNEASIFLILILTCMAGWYMELNDVNGAFLNGLFSHGEKPYMYVPKGFERYYPSGMVLLLLKTIYGLKQSAFEYWRTLLNAIRAMRLTRNKADPCVYFKWGALGLMIWSSWVDDLLSGGNKTDVTAGKQILKQYFDLDEVGEMKEYVGCKVEYNKGEGWVKLTQPVLLQSFEDEFELPETKFNTPAEPGSVLTKGEVPVDADTHANYRKGVGKLIHLAKYSRPGISNAVRELSRFGNEPSHAHVKAMLRCMKYCTDTKNQGLKLNPTGKWDGKDKNYKFKITGKSDSDYAKDPDTRRSVSGWAAFLNDAPYTRKSRMQKFVTLSVTEAECVAATECVQDMLYGKRFLESLGLQVELPMVLYMDNKGGVDIFNSWSIAGNTRAISVRFAFIRELKEAGVLKIEWIEGKKNSADLFTKNLSGPDYEKHVSEYEDIAQAAEGSNVREEE